MVRDRVLYNFEQFLLRVGGANRESVQELHHQTGESFECTRNAHCRTDFDENAFGCVDVDLKQAGLVDG